jgi:hypothetical protein
MKIVEHDARILRVLSVADGATQRRRTYPAKLVHDLRATNAGIQQHSLSNVQRPTLRWAQLTERRGGADRHIAQRGRQLRRPPEKWNFQPSIGTAKRAIRATISSMFLLSRCSMNSASQRLGGRTRARTWDPMIKSHLLFGKRSTVNPTNLSLILH